MDFSLNTLFQPYNSQIEFKTFLILLENITSLSKEIILSQKTIKLNDKKLQLLKSYINRLKKKEPIEYILNQAYFRDNNYFVTNSVLIPRIETERLIDIAFKILNNKFHSKKLIYILEIGTGSGCISIELALLLLTKRRSNFKILATDISGKAINIAKKNRNNLLNQNQQIKNLINFKKANIIPQRTSIKFDLIISNPPYIPAREINTLPDSVKNYEPHIALNGGIDGLKIFKEIIQETTKNKTDETTYIFEIHSPKANQLESLLQNLHAQNIQFFDDQFNRKRFVSFTLP